MLTSGNAQVNLGAEHCGPTGVRSDGKGILEASAISWFS